MLWQNGKIAVNPARYSGWLKPTGWRLAKERMWLDSNHNAKRCVMYASDKSQASRASFEGSELLIDGLRMFWELAQCTPIDLSDFAEMNALSTGDAARLMNAFEQCGYVYRLSSNEQYELTPQAVSIVGSIDQSRALTAPTLQ